METVVIVDFGSQTVQLIARQVRNEGVYCEVVSWVDAYNKILKY